MRDCIVSLPQRKRPPGFAGGFWAPRSRIDHAERLRLLHALGTRTAQTGGSSQQRPVRVGMVNRNDVLSTTAMWSAAEHEGEAGRQMVPTRRFQGRVTCSRPLMNTPCVVTWSAANTFHQFLMLGRMPGALGVLVGSPAFQSTLPQIWFHVLAVHAFKPKIRLAADCSTCIKVVLLGSSASGAKTSFIARFVNGTFATNPNATICANFTTKQVATCKWQLWDTTLRAKKDSDV